ERPRARTVGFRSFPRAAGLVQVAERRCRFQRPARAAPAQPASETLPPHRSRRRALARRRRARACSLRRCQTARAERRARAASSPSEGPLVRSRASLGLGSAACRASHHSAPLVAGIASRQFLAAADTVLTSSTAPP